MAKKIELTGQKFNMLTVLRKIPFEERHNYVKTDKFIGTLYECKCDCGNIKVIRGKSITTGHTKSCGCYNYTKDRSNPYNSAKLEGQRFGKVVVIRKLTKEEGKANKGDIWKNDQNYWLCKCDCGNTLIKTTGELHDGLKSCGCEKSHGEYKITQILNKNNISYIQQYQLCKNPKTNYLLRVDYFVNNKYVIEYDGEQHFNPIHTFGTNGNFESGQERDKVKNDYCKEHNIPIIRIPYTQYENLNIDDLKLETSKFLLH